MSKVRVRWTEYVRGTRTYEAEFDYSDVEWLLREEFESAEEDIHLSDTLTDAILREAKKENLQSEEVEIDGWDYDEIEELE